MERYTKIQSAMFEVLEWVFDYERIDEIITKQDLVEVVQNTLGQKSVSTAHTIIDVMVAMQYLTVDDGGKYHWYRLTTYGGNLLWAYKQMLEGNREKLYEADYDGNADDIPF